MSRRSKVVTVSLPPEDASELERMAREEGRNRSDLVREMLRVCRVYRETGRFEALQRYGAARARALGIHDERDVGRLIRQARAG